MSHSRDAYDWAVRRGVGPLSPDEQAELELWLAADPRRKGALLKAEATRALVRRTQAVRPFFPLTEKLSRRRTLGWMSGAVAAGLGTVVLIPKGDRLSTGIGEIRRTRLADASTVTLNTHSRVRVDLEPHERNVSLDRGEAWFQVAHDRARPFVVSAASLRVRAVGTAFSVRRMDHGVLVLVTDGTVEVWRADQPDQRASVTRDHRVFVPDDSIAIVPVEAGEDIERALAWRRRRVAFAGEALEDAIAEINRYNAVQLRVDDPTLGRTPIVGYFSVDDPAGFARTIAFSEGATVEADGTNLRIMPRQS